THLWLLRTYRRTDGGSRVPLRTRRPHGSAKFSAAQFRVDAPHSLLNHRRRSNRPHRRHWREASRISFDRTGAGGGDDACRPLADLGITSATHPVKEAMASRDNRSAGETILPA